MLGNQLQHSLLEGFVGNWRCWSAVGVVGRSSETSAFFPPMLRNLLLLANHELRIGLDDENLCF